MHWNCNAVRKTGCKQRIEPIINLQVVSAESGCVFRFTGKLYKVPRHAVCQSQCSIAGCKRIPDSPKPVFYRSEIDRLKTRIVAAKRRHRIAACGTPASLLV